MNLNTPIGQIPKVGSFHTSRLKKLKIETVEDLVHHYPFRYENLGTPVKINALKVGERVSTAGKVEQIQNIRTRYGKNLTFATINDGTASIEAVWFNQPFLVKTVTPGAKIGLAGKIDYFSHKPTLINPDYELLNKPGTKGGFHTKGLVPIYPETSRLSSKWLRNKIKEMLPMVVGKIDETLSSESRSRNSLITKRQALWQIHFPNSEEQVKQARRRLAFEEIFITSLQAIERKASWEKLVKARPLNIHQEKILTLISNLPFNLTSSQNKVIKEILADLSAGKSMNRLLQGDVGSGKTVVAAIAAYVAYLNGYQTAFMAPTEILAAQHLKTLTSILSPLGVKLSIRTSSSKKRGPFDIIVGTHAILSKNVTFDNLALVIIDEQHRFGVEQRALLRTKAKRAHVLTMTATPIPRSLALVIFGDLDISTLDELPQGRKKIKTFVVPPEKRNRAYQFLRNKILEKRQAFIICPIIEPSETLSTAKAAKEEYSHLKTEVFPDLKLGLLHGKMKHSEKEIVLENFRDNNLNILVATPVVEVGIDVPNATVMMIEAAERFGLASLHQLRGRVGRSDQQAYCLLFTESSTENVIERLSSLEKHHLGLKLAKIDLKMRGPGHIFGTAQSGIPSFKIAELTDLPLINAARNEANLVFNQQKVNFTKSLRKGLEKQPLVTPD
ncbi:MAG: ATP-dependent DNA helicase RecG [bacterium]|nr:ATP-dependent DNA helicase RecG [bacterium]